MTTASFQPTSAVTTSPRLAFDDDFERLGVRGLFESLIGLDDLVQLEMVGDQLADIDARGLHGFEQHRFRESVHQARGDRHVVLPQSLKVPVDLDAVHPCVGGAAPNLHLAVQHVTLESGGQDDVGHHQGFFVGRGWNRVQAGFGLGNPNVFSLGAVDAVSQDAAAGRSM